MRERPRILFYFLHLLGVGHVYRAKRLIQGFARQGLDVDVIYGGVPIGEAFQSASTYYLPPIQAQSADYKNYLDSNGGPLTDEYLAARQEQLLAHFKTLRPDMILFEAFPFGRRVVRREIVALIEAAEARDKPPMIVTSVRDILQPRSKSGRYQETRDTILTHIDKVLVHSDPALIRLDETFPLTDAISDRIAYTGFVVPEVEAHTDAETFDVIVTAGGGGFGFDLMKRAIEVSARDGWRDMTWCLATGPHLLENDVAELTRHAGENVTITKRLDGLADHLARAKVSISQCGYNTAMDVLAVHSRSTCRAVFVPYDIEGQVEQSKRAELLELAGFAINLPQSKLTTDALEAAMNRAMNLPSTDHQVDFDGVETTTKIVRAWLMDRRVK